MKKASRKTFAEIKTVPFPESKSVLFWLIMGFMIVFMFVAPFQRGLFNGGQFSFERPIYMALIWSAVALFLVALYFFKHWKLDDHRDILAVAIWLIPLSYFISMINAASYHLAMNEFYLHAMYAVFFLIGAYFAGNRLGAIILQAGLAGSGYMLVIHGLLNWFGNVHYRDAVLGFNRLSGVFQYPNTYAAFLIGMFMVSLILASSLKRWYTIIPNALMLVPIFISFLLTLSRGGLVIVPFVLLVYLLFIPWRKQLFALLYIAISAACSLAVFSQISAIRTQLNKEFVGSVSLKGWAILISLSLIVSIVIYGIQKFVCLPLYQKRPENKVFQLTNFIMPVIFVALTTVMAFLLFGNDGFTEKLPNEMKQRIKSINLEDSSALARGTFYTDSLKIVKDYPIVGAGGGAWASLYEAYKSYPYSSRQTHNVISQSLVETGLLGFAVFILLLGYIWFYFIRQVNRLQGSEWKDDRLVFPLFSLVILIHSAIDFDMSFVYLSALVFLSLGTMVSASGAKKLPTLIPFKYAKVNKVFPLLLSITAVMLFFGTVQAVRANTLFAKANDVLKETQNYNEIQQSLDAAIKLQRKHPDYALFKTSLLIQLYSQTKNEQFADEAVSLLQGLQRTEPNNRQMIELQYAWFMAKGENEQALNWVNSKLAQLPWDINLYEKAITLNFELGNQARKQNLSDQMTEHWNNALMLLSYFNDKINEIKTLPKGQQTGYTFKLTPNMALTVGQIYYMQGKYNQATGILKTVVSTNFDDSINRVTARWYLASLQKQNKNDKSLFDNLVKKYPDEKQQIEAIVANQ